jgi:hypothetical protein
MSNRRSNGGAGPTPAQPVRGVPMQSLYDIGRQIVALENIHDAYDTQELERGLPGHKLHALYRAKSLISAQTEALVDLGLAMVPETVPDVVAQLVMTDRRLDWLVACDMPAEEMRTIAEDVLHVVRAALPLLAKAGGIALADVSNAGGNFSAWERLEMVEAV